MYELKVYTPDPPGPWIQCCIHDINNNANLLFNAKFNTVEKYVHLDLYIYAHAQLSAFGARAHPG